MCNIISGVNVAGCTIHGKSWAGNGCAYMTLLVVSYGTLDEDRRLEPFPR
jgi:hypothetical protein